MGGGAPRRGLSGGYTRWSRGLKCATTLADRKARVGNRGLRLVKERY